jgi:Mn2+/Fe2+ NRAMP family transporter
MDGTSQLLQSASLIATVAGQAVSEGFLNWRVSVSTEILDSVKED